MNKRLIACLAISGLLGASLAGGAWAQTHSGTHSSGSGGHSGRGHDGGSNRGHDFGGHNGGHGRFFGGFGIALGLPFWGPWPYYYPSYPYYPYYSDDSTYTSYVEDPAYSAAEKRLYVNPGPGYRLYCPDPPGYFPQVRRCNQRFLQVVPDDGSGPTNDGQRDEQEQEAPDQD
jgi:hypothetical protein